MPRKGRFGRGITHIVIHGSAYWKVQVNRQGQPHIQRHFKNYSDAREYAISLFQSLGDPVESYADLMDPHFYAQFMEA